MRTFCWYCFDRNWWCNIYVLQPDLNYFCLLHFQFLFGSITLQNSELYFVYNSFYNSIKCVWNIVINKRFLYIIIITNIIVCVRFVRIHWFVVSLKTYQHSHALSKPFEWASNLRQFHNTYFWMNHVSILLHFQFLFHSRREFQSSNGYNNLPLINNRRVLFHLKLSKNHGHIVEILYFRRFKMKQFVWNKN